MVQISKIDNLNKLNVLKRFWKEESEYTPESRIETHKYNEELKRKDEKEKKG